MPTSKPNLSTICLRQDTDYTEHWLTFWNDWLRNGYAGFGLETADRYEISRWLYNALLTNKPYDEFARELISPKNLGSQGYAHGFRSRGKLTQQQSPAMQFTENATQLFLGINFKCAACHDSRIDKWTQSDVFSMAAIYSADPIVQKIEGAEDQVAKAAWIFPDLGTLFPTMPRLSRMEELSWLVTDAENGHFARAIVNRLWAQLMGRGIVAPLDGMHHQPWNEGLLEYLAGYLVEKEYDLKAVLRHIATSQAYRSVTQSETADRRMKFMCMPDHSRSV